MSILVVLQNIIGDNVKVLNTGIESETIKIWGAHITDIKIKSYSET